MAKATRRAPRRRPARDPRMWDRGAKHRPRPFVRHAPVALLAAALVGVFWASRPTWSSEMRLWKAVGDAALVLLVVTLALGPAARLGRWATPLLPWRR